MSVNLLAEPLLLVRGDGDYPPFEMVQGGKLTGAHIELVEAAAREAGVSIRIDSLPWTRALEMVKRGHAEAILFASRSPEREAFLLFEPDNVLSTLTFSFFRKNGETGLQRWEGDFSRLQGSRIGILRSYAYPTGFSAAPGLTRIALDGGNQALSQALRHGRIDLALANTVEMNDYLASQGLQERISAIPPSFGQNDSYLAFARSKADSGLAQRFAEAFRRLKAKGQYQQIWRRYRLSGPA